MSQTMPQATKKQYFIDGLSLLAYAGYVVFFISVLLQGMGTFYGVSDIFTYLLIAAIYGFGCLFFLDLCQSWIYFPLGLINGLLALLMIYRMRGMAQAGMLALTLNTFLFLVPMAVFAIMFIHVKQRKKQIRA